MAAQPSYTLVPKDKADLSVQEYAKNRKKDEEEKKARRIAQMLLASTKIEDQFDALIRSIELESDKWRESFDSIKKELDSKHQEEFKLKTISFNEILDSSMDLLHSFDMEKVMSISPCLYSHRIKITGHPLQGCLIFLKYKKTGLDLRVNVKEELWCSLV